MSELTQLIPSTRPGMTYGDFRVFGSNPSEDGSLNLYCEGMSAPYGFLNLFLTGCGYTQEGSLNLCLYNMEIVGSLNLVTIGEGIQDGAYPASGSLNLYIERPTDGSLNLFCSGEQLPVADGQVTQLTSLCMTGPMYGNFESSAYTVFASLNLSMPYTVGNGTGTLFLYCHGF